MAKPVLNYQQCLRDAAWGEFKDVVPNSLPLPLQGPLVRTQVTPLSQQLPASGGDRREGPANPQPEQASETPPAGPHHGTEEEPTQASPGPNVSPRARGHEPRSAHLQAQCHSWCLCSPGARHGALGSHTWAQAHCSPWPSPAGPRLTQGLASRDHIPTPSDSSPSQAPDAREAGQGMDTDVPP